MAPEDLVALARNLPHAKVARGAGEQQLLLDLRRVGTEVALCHLALEDRLPLSVQAELGQTRLGVRARGDLYCLLGLRHLAPLSLTLSLGQSSAFRGPSCSTLLG